MCTVTVVPTATGLRIAFNRDERYDRPPALAPTAHQLLCCTALYPVDPLCGGTWIGVNDRGIVAALLNRTLRPNPAGLGHLSSRGLVVPAILDTELLDAALTTAANINVQDYAPFRLLIIAGTRGHVFESDGFRLSCAHADLTQPYLLTSSSLGDHLVAGPRARLFRRMMNTDPPAWLAAQQQFHDHQWPLRRDVSVRMERSDARTVSRTVIDVTRREIRVFYEPVLDIFVNQVA
jgi:hypothetical protein